MKPHLTKSQQETELIKNPINDFSCGHNDCKKVDAMSFHDFKNHLLLVHQLKPEQLKGNRKMTMHMDGDFWFSYSYEWELETGLKFYQYIKMARQKGDPMRFEY